MSFDYGTLEEVIAIQEFHRERKVIYLLGASSAASPEKAGEIVNKLYDAIFPEGKSSDVDLMVRNKRVFEKLKGVNLNVKRG
jgi:hypothetical protein